MAYPFDLTQYIRAPRLDVAASVALGRQLLSAVPSAPTPTLKSATKALRGAHAALQHAWIDRSRTSRTDAVRPVDTRVDRAWHALFSRLDAYASLPVETFPAAADAARIRDRVFAGGLRFLQYAFHAQWAECDLRLGLIATDHLAPAIDALAGPEFLAHVRAMHAEYGAALGISRAHPAVAEAPSFHELLRAFNDAVATYALQVLALDEPNDASEAAEARRAEIRAALRPIDEVRERSASGARTSSEPPAPEPTPAPSPDAPKPPAPPPDPER